MNSSYDLLIIGAGPAGLAAALNAHKSGLRYLLLEKENHIADTAHGYQRGKLVMSEPSAIPLRGELWFQPTLRETVLQHWEEAVRAANLELKLGQRVRAIKRGNGGFEVATEQDIFTAAKVVVAIGSQGNPRRLGVPGEDLPHVLTRLTDPALYSDQDIVVVGGGDSAIEVAAALATRNRVTMVVRTPEFIRAKDALERQALELANRKELTIHFNAAVGSIDASFVTLQLSSSTVKVRAGVVIVKIGALPPRQFLEDCGVRFTGPEPLGVPDLGAGYETNIPGLFVIGAAGGHGDLIKHGINQGHEVVERICGRAVEPVDEAPLRERLALSEGTVAQRIQQLLPKAPLLTGASEAQIRELLFFSNFRRVAPGEIVFRQNDFSESLHMILDGTLEILTRGDDGAERSVVKMAAGEFFGEMSLMSGRRRSGTVRALQEAYLWEVGRKAMLKFIHMLPQAKRLIDRAFVVRAFQIYVFPQADYAVLSNIAGRADVLIALAARGLGVLAYDYRGYGRSEGQPSETGVYLDAEAAYDSLRAKGVPPGRIVAFGESLGGAVAIRLATVRPCAGVAVVSTFTTLHDAGRAHYGPLALLAGDRFDSLARVRGLAGPIFVAHGEVIAGVDLQKMLPEDLWVKDRIVYMVLPDPEVFVVTLDNQKSYVYNRDTGLLTKGDPNLEKAAREAAEKEILAAAMDDGILNLAKQNAENYISRLMRGLGFADVVFVPAPFAP